MTKVTDEHSEDDRTSYRSETGRVLMIDDVVSLTQELSIHGKTWEPNDRFRVVNSTDSIAHLHSLGTGDVIPAHEFVHCNGDGSTLICVHFDMNEEDEVPLLYEARSMATDELVATIVSDGVLTSAVVYALKTFKDQVLNVDAITDRALNLHFSGQWLTPKFHEVLADAYTSSSSDTTARTFFQVHMDVMRQYAYRLIRMAEYAHAWLFEAWPWVKSPQTDLDISQCIATRNQWSMRNGKRAFLFSGGISANVMSLSRFLLNDTCLQNTINAMAEAGELTTEAVIEFFGSNSGDSKHEAIMYYTYLLIKEAETRFNQPLDQMMGDDPIVKAVQSGILKLDRSVK